jgi:hypothetical protein
LARYKSGGGGEGDWATFGGGGGGRCLLFDEATGFSLTMGVYFEAAGVVAVDDVDWPGSGLAVGLGLEAGVGF